MWSAITTKAATPAANMPVARVEAEVAGAVRAADSEPRTDFSVVVFIFSSLHSTLYALAIQIIKTMNAIIGFLRMRFHFIFMMQFIHNSDK
jgi:hypothetical protein